MDGQEVQLEEGTEGVILSNIPSYGGGAHLWTNKEEYVEVTPTSADDDGRDPEAGQASEFLAEDYSPESK